VTLTGPAAARLQVTRIVRFTFELIRHNQLRFFALSTIVAGPAAFLAYNDATYPDANLWDAPFALPFAAYAVGGALLTAAITRMIVPDGAGHYPSLAQSIGAVVNDLPALGAIGLISNIAILVGFLALVLPGLILGAILAVLIPVRTIEQAGFVRTCARSAILTKGNVWPIVGLLMAVIALEVAGDIVVNIMMGDPPLAGYSGEAQSNGAAAILGSTLVATAISLIGATGTAVLYCELRRIKDGPAPREFASVFD
jgi:hypothetical protein